MTEKTNPFIPDLTNPKDLRNFLKKYNIWTKKKFGQNFLIDRQVLKDIIAEADISKGELVVEVGPGHGVLTQELLNAQAKVEAVEVDETVIPALKSSTYRWKDYIDIFLQHVLEFTVPEKEYKFVANIPYHLTSSLLRKFLIESENRPTKMVMMVQKEVADKICCKEGKDCLLSILVKTFGKPKYLQTVAAEKFFPAPKVDSAVLVIDVYDKPLISENTPKKIYFEMLFSGFKNQRKKLKNVLMASFLKTEAQVLEIFNKVGVDPDFRAQNLNIQQWEKLTPYFFEGYFKK